MLCRLLKLVSKSLSRESAFRYQLDDAELSEIRALLNKGLAVGSERFKDQIKAAVARSVRPGQAGRKKVRTAGGLSGEQESLRFEEGAK